MRRTVGVILVILAAVIPLTARAGLGHRPWRHCGHCWQPFLGCKCPRPYCGGCGMAPLACHCPPMPVAPVNPCPPINPCPPPVTICPPINPCPPVGIQPMTQIGIQRQAQIVDVPVTTYKQVTVDQGSYQQVWVPKLVNQLVPETTLQKQVQYRDVPYQITQQVPVIGGASSCCNGTLNSALITPLPSVAATPLIPTAIAPTPQPTASLAPVPEPYMQAASPKSIPTDPVQTAETPKWTKVPQKESGGNVELQSYETVSNPSARGKFSPAPSAATVWQAQSRF